MNLFLQPYLSICLYEHSFYCREKISKEILTSYERVCLQK